MSKNTRKEAVSMKKTKRGGSKSKSAKKSKKNAAQKKGSQKKTTKRDSAAPEVIMRPTLETMHSNHDNLMHAIKPISKPIILLIHANWCGHCQRLMPAWDAMQHKITADPNVNNRIEIRRIESEELPHKMDEINADLYDNGKVVVDGYPTIGEIHDKHFTPYNGERDPDSLIMWVKTVASK
jgi:thiol-disulfide isomerase/thioredoxin